MMRRGTVDSAGRYSAVGTTRYGVEDTGFEPGKDEIFPNRRGPPSLLHIWYRVSFPGLKQPGRTVNHPHHLAPLGLHGQL